MSNQKVISKTSTITTTNEFSNKNLYVFLEDQAAAYEILEAAGVKMNFENEDEAWTDIMCDNSDCRRWFAVYGEGSRMSNAHAEYVEIEPSERNLEDLITFLPE